MFANCIQQSALKIILFATLVVLFLSACKFNKLEQSTGDAYLQGLWQEDALLKHEDLVSWQTFRFKFTCDSFYATIHNVSKVNLDGGPCYQEGNWDEYAKGYYKVVGDTLKFDGNFVDAEFKYKTVGSCYRNGKFTDLFLITAKTDSVIHLKNLQTGTTQQLLLQQKLVCK